MSDIKTPGQVAYETFHPSGLWMLGAENYRAEWEAVAQAVLDHAAQNAPKAVRLPDCADGPVHDFSTVTRKRALCARCGMWVTKGVPA